MIILIFKPHFISFLSFFLCTACPQRYFSDTWIVDLLRVRSQTAKNRIESANTWRLKDLFADNNKAKWRLSWGIENEKWKLRVDVSANGSYIGWGLAPLRTIYVAMLCVSWQSRPKKRQKGRSFCWLNEMKNCWPI